MSLPQNPIACTEAPPREKTRGERYEGVAFTFCKAATIILLTQKYALIAAAGAATVFYLLAHFNGQRETRCMLRKPLLSAGFWGVVCLAALYGTLRPVVMRWFSLA